MLDAARMSWLDDHALRFVRV